jgi:hypothetical protein
MLFLQKISFVIRIQEIFRRNRKIIFIVFLILVFFFRLMYGLFSEFWLEDELQVYLIGLKFYCSGLLPHWGPDVVYTQTQLPGALQGLLVGGTFFLLPIPEAPYIFLSLLTFSALCLLAVYIRKRVPEIPGWFTWAWIMLCPWTINYSNHVVNPSYVLPAAILFFIGFFEVVPKLQSGFIGHKLAMLIIGFSLFWIFQLHKSWVLLLPFTIIALWYAFRYSKKTILFFLAGCLITGSMLIPVFMDFLNGKLNSTGESVIIFNPKNIGTILTVLSRYLSLASFELPIFIGSNGQIRLEFIRNYYLLSPFIIAAVLIGLVQPVYLAVAFFIKNPSPSFKIVKWLAFITFLMVWVSFFFSIKGPSSHTFYLVFPLVMIYSFYCWLPLFQRKWFRYLMAFMLIAGIFTHSAIAHRNFKSKSMYVNREKAVKAIQQKKYYLLGERRSFDRNP